MGPRRMFRVLAGAGAVALVAGVPAAPAAGDPALPLTGVVTADGRPVPHAWVRYLPVTGSGRWAGQGQGALTDDLGRYTFAAVAADQVKVHVRAPAVGGLVSTYFPQAFTFADAGVVRVGRGARADVALPRGGSIRGRVVDAQSGEPLEGAVVSAHAGTGATESVGAAGLSLGPDGTFTLADLPPVPLALRVEAPAAGDHLGQWYDAVGYPQVAARIDGAARTAGVVVGLERGASIRGTVRDDAGQPVAGARVALVGCRGRCPMGTTTDAEGRYELRGVPAGGGMLLQASAEGTGLLEAFHRAPGSDREAWLRVAAGAALADVDVTLRRGAWLVVRVVDADTGDPVRLAGAELVSASSPLLSYLPGVRDRLLVWSGGGFAPAPDATSDRPAEGASDATSAAPAGAGREGPLMFGPIPAGDYRVNLFPGQGNPAYLPLRIHPDSDLGTRARVRLAPMSRLEVTVRLVADDVAQGADRAAAAQVDAVPSPVRPWPRGAWAVVAPAALGDPAPVARTPAGDGWPLALAAAGMWPGLAAAGPDLAQPPS
jgi:hypothetical protein